MNEKKKRLCKLCGRNPPTVPDWEIGGSMRKTVCIQCHRQRLKDDLERILVRQARKK